MVSAGPNQKSVVPTPDESILNLLALVNKYSRLRKIPPYSDKLEQIMLKAVDFFRSELLNETDIVPFEHPPEWSFSELYIKTKELIEYRNFLSKAKNHEEAFQSQYLKLIASDKFFRNATRGQNPFILNEHLIRLYNIAINLDDKASLLACRQEVLDLLHIFASLKHDFVGHYQLYLQTFGYYTLAAVDARLAPSTGVQTVGKWASQIITIHPCQTALSECDFLLKFGKLSALTLRQDAHLSFYAMGDDLFNRTPFVSIDEWIKSIADLQVVSAQTLTFNYERAQQAHAAIEVKSLAGAVEDMHIQDESSRQRNSL